MRKRPAFTLLELAVAVAVAAILGTFGYASYSSYIRKSNDNTAIGLADELAQNLAHYAALNSAVYPANLNSGWNSTVTALGTLAEFPSTPPAVFKASSTDTAGNNLLSYSNSAGSTFQIEFKASGGTGQAYCRDPNGLASITWQNAGPFAGCP